MYRTYYFPVDVDLSANAENTLRIDIESSMKYAFEQRAKDPYKTKGFHLNNTWPGESWIQMIRTQSTDFGWDWAPAVSPQGIYGEVLLTSQPYELENPIVKQTFSQNLDKAEVEVFAQIRYLADKKDKINFEGVLEYNGQQVATIQKEISQSDLKKGDGM